MAKKHDDDAPVLSEVEARAGVTGHHVRHVLVFGLAGSVIAFVVIALYFYYAKLISALSQASAQIGLTRLVYITTPLALGAVAVVLVLGLWNMVATPKLRSAKPRCAGGSRSNSSRFAWSWRPSICQPSPRLFAPPNVFTRSPRCASHACSHHWPFPWKTYKEFFISL